eukprot:3303445-Rhodomonas_salina.1
MWWHMLHRGWVPSTNVRSTMEQLKAVWYYFQVQVVPAGMSLPNLQVTPHSGNWYQGTHSTTATVPGRTCRSLSQSDVTAGDSHCDSPVTSSRYY